MTTFRLPASERRVLSLCSAFATEFLVGNAELSVFTDPSPTFGMRKEGPSSTVLGSLHWRPAIRAGQSVEGEPHDGRQV